MTVYSVKMCDRPADIKGEELAMEKCGRKVSMPMNRSK